MGPAGKEKQERLQEIFEGKSEDLGKGKKHPLIRHSRESGSPVHSSKAKSLDGVHIAQLSDYHRLNNCFASGRCPGMSPGPKADPPGIKAGTSQPSSSGSSSNSSSSNSSGNPSWGGRQNGFTVLFVLGLIGLALGIGVVAAGGAAAAGISAGALNAIWGVSGSFAAAGLLGMLPKEAWEGIGKAFAATGTTIGGLLAGLLHNLLLGFVDLKIDSDSTWAKIFNVSQEIGKWLTLVGGAAAGFTTAGITMAGVLNLPSVLVPVGFSVGGAMTGSGLTQLLTFAVKSLKLKASESDRDEERSKTYALKGEIANMGVADEDVQKALNGLEKPPWPQGKLTLGEETEHNKTLSEYYKKYQEALKELKGNEILKRNKEQAEDATLKKSLDQAQGSKVKPGLFKIIKQDLKNSPVPPSPPGAFFRIYPSPEGGYLKVKMSDRTGHIEVQELIRADYPWQGIKGETRNDPDLGSSLQNAITQEILRQEEELRTQSYGSPNQWGYSDNLAQMFIYDPQNQTTLLYEAVYRNDSQGRPQIVVSQAFDSQAPGKAIEEFNGNPNLLARSVPVAMLHVSQEEKLVPGSCDFEDCTPSVNKTIYEIHPRIIQVPLDLSHIPAEQPKTDAKTRKQEEMDRICNKAKDEFESIGKQGGLKAKEAYEELIKACSEAAEKLKEQENEDEEGDPIYRVYGPRYGVDEENRPADWLYGAYWTNVDPRIGILPIPTHPDVGLKSMYRIMAGLPNANLGICLAIGKLKKNNHDGIKIKKAEFANPRLSPDPPHDYKWQRPSWPELVVIMPEGAAPEIKKKTVLSKIKIEKECEPVKF